MEESEASANVWLRTRQDADQFVAAAARRTTPGMATMIFADRSGKAVDLFCIEGGGEQLPELVELTCSQSKPEICGLVLVTDRTGEVPADRPDDELTWLELHVARHSSLP